VVAIPALFVALVTVASLKQPILIPRILCWMTLPLGVAVAYAIVVPSKLRVLARLMTLAAFGVGLYWQIALADGAKPPFREIFGETRAELTHADDVVLAPYASAVLLKYYGPPIRNLVKWHDPAVTGIESNQMIDQFGIPLRTRQQVIDDIKSGKSVALVVTSPDARFMPALMNDVPPPQRQVESTCNIVPHDGVPPPPCIAVYGWNMPSNVPLATRASQ
jgi:mannosyltransferase